MKETWAWVRGFEDELQVSDQGRVRAIFEALDIENMNPLKVCRILEPIKMTQYYLGVNYKGYPFLIHNLVAEAFIPNPEGKRLIIHKNGNRHKNQATNLQWQTNSECAKQLITEGKMPKPKGYRGRRVVCIETGEEFFGIRNLANKLGCKVPTLEKAIYLGKPIDGFHYTI